MLVEDDPVSAGALKAILGRLGWDIAVAPTVASARQQLAILDQPWIILDLMLPDGDGATLLTQIDPAARASRVIVTTAVSDTERLAQLKKMTPRAVLRKPLELTELLGILGGASRG